MPLNAARVRSAFACLVGEWSLLLLQQPEYLAVGLVYDFGLQRGEVYLCGLLGVVSHAFTYYGERYAFVAGYACPRMAGAVHGEWLMKPQSFAYLLQMAVDEEEGVAVLPDGVAGGVFDYREHVGRACVGRVCLYDLLHAGFPLYGELAVGLFPAVEECVAFEVFLLQVGYVDKGHAACVEAEQEHVAGKALGCVVAAVHCLELLYGSQGDGALGGLLAGGGYAPEGFLVGDEPVFNGAVVDGAQVFHVEGYGVGREVALPQVAFVGFYQLGVYGVEVYVVAVGEAAEAVHGGAVCLAGAVLPLCAVACCHLCHVAEEGVPGGVLVVLGYDGVDAAGGTGLCEALGYAFQAAGVVAHCSFYGAAVFGAGGRLGLGKCLVRGVPFVGHDGEWGGYVPCGFVVCDSVVEPAFFPLGGRRRKV